jgi:hypothetical protein
VRSWNNNRWGVKAAPVILRLHVTPDGYHAVNLGRGIVKRVNRLVCQAFSRAPNPGEEAAHQNGNPADDSAANLSWVTPVVNASHKRLHGTLPIGERAGSAKLRAADVLAIRRRRAAGERNMDLAAEFGVSPQSISGITKATKWKHLSEGVA